RYVPRQMNLGSAYSSNFDAHAQGLDILLYPNAYITVRVEDVLGFPDHFDPEFVHPSEMFTTYTKHYYIGSERIASKIGWYNKLGIPCDYINQDPTLVSRMNTHVDEASTQLLGLFYNLGKKLGIDRPYQYHPLQQLSCSFYQNVPQEYDAYWYHPDHLGSSSYITNTTGEISQHMEYLPFGETLVEEHLNSYNSPFKFNGKEYDAETGNYYYGARYMNPKWSIFFTPDLA